MTYYITLAIDEQAGDVTRVDVLLLGVVRMTAGTDVVTVPVDRTLADSAPAPATAEGSLLCKKAETTDRQKALIVSSS